MTWNNTTYAFGTCDECNFEHYEYDFCKNWKEVGAKKRFWTLRKKHWLLCIGSVLLGIVLGVWGTLAAISCWWCF